MKKIKIFHLLIAILFVISFTSCGGGSGSGDGGGSGNGGGTSGGGGGNTTTIGPNGGTVTSSDGKASVIIPAGALSQETAITVDSTASPGSGNIGTVYNFAPDGTTFSLPVTISIQYDDTALPQGVSEQNLKLGTFANNQWQEVAGSTVDTTLNVVNGNTGHFSPYSIIPPVTVTDIDGNVYNTVTIGTQVWMKENLKVTKYRNGNDIGTTTPATLDISGQTTPKYQWAYFGNESNVTDYGRLYTWYAVTDSRGVCPTGWHVPTAAEWTTLTDYLGGEGVAGGKMKETGTAHWNFNTGADNSSGFTGLPSGYRQDWGGFFSIGDYGFWWSATESSATYAWYRNLNWYDTYAARGSSNKNDGLSVRCVRD